MYKLGTLLISSISHITIKKKKQKAEILPRNHLRRNDIVPTLSADSFHVSDKWNASLSESCCLWQCTEGTHVSEWRQTD